MLRLYGVHLEVGGYFTCDFWQCEVVLLSEGVCHYGQISVDYRSIIGRQYRLLLDCVSAVYTLEIDCLSYLI